MALRSRYREKIPAAETRAPNIPEEPIQPSESVHINFDTKAEPAIGIVSADEYPQPDEATLTLQKQIADLKKSEEMQREFARHVAAQRAAQMAAPEPTLPADPEARIALWRTQGLDEGDAAFLSEHLEMVERPDLTRIASDEAAEHHQRGTDDHRAATLEAFHRLQGQQTQAQPAPAATPEFFRPPPAPSPSRTEPSALFSAPVSRQAQSDGTGQRPARTIRLTAEEQEYARVAGVSDVEYAKQKQKLAAAKANGDYGERR
jgi:hypothetical protein